jgi:hypothetical protein
MEHKSKVHISKHVSDNFSIHSGLKQGDALSPLLFNFALEYAIMKAHTSFCLMLMMLICLEIT